MCDTGSRPVKATINLKHNAEPMKVIKRIRDSQTNQILCTTSSNINATSMSMVAPTQNVNNKVIRRVKTPLVGV
jgi:hypothetical protein